MRQLRAIASAGPLLFIASAAQAAEGGDSLFWWEMGNLALLIGLLFYFGKGPVVDYFRSHKNDVEESIARSESLLSNAESRLAEWEAKANGLEAEVAEIKASTKRAAEQQRDAIIAEANETAERIRASAGAVVERETLQARESLRKEAADMAVEMARELLGQQVNEGDRSRLVDEFIGSLESGGRA